MTHRHPRLRRPGPTWTAHAPPGHLQSIASWDQAANMPPKGNDARAAALAEMAALLHRMRTDPNWAGSSARRAGAAVDLQRANLREIRANGALPTRCPNRWCSAAAGHRALRTRLAPPAPGQRLGRLPGQLPRGAGHRRAKRPAAGRPDRPAPYDALMDRFEPGMTCATGRPHVFGDVRSGCRADPAGAGNGSAARTADRTGGARLRWPAQRALCEQVMRCWASTSRPAGWTSAPTRSAAACPRTCA
jgi:carboxypeptidase Taq